MSRRRLIAVLIMVSVLPARGQDFTSADIVAVAGSNSDCLQWRVARICFWLVCGLFYCSIETSAKVAHNLPDLVVTSYNQPGESPWIEGRAVAGAVSTGAGAGLIAALTGLPFGGGTLSSDNNENRQNLRFKEVDVIGSPTGVLTDVLADFTGYLCPSQVDPMLPYYLSGVDALAWRTGIPDKFRPEALTPGLRQIGNWPFNTWGGVFPRMGFLVQTDDAKVGAVTSQRAIDIVLQPGQPHVYVPLGSEGFTQTQVGRAEATTSDECLISGGRWVPEDEDHPQGPGACEQQPSVLWLPPGNEKKPSWQMVSPLPSRTCEAFGAPGHWSEGRVSPTGDYGHLYWRCYECCMPVLGGVFIADTEWAGCE